MKILHYLLLLLYILVQGCNGDDSQTGLLEHDIRPPAVAGKFYPADPEKLRLAIEGYIKDADIWASPTGAQPIAIIVPHAGYIYSGQIAADAFKRATQNQDIDLVVILGTNHTTPGFDDISIYPKGGYRTPLGVAEIDADIAAQLTKSDKKCVFRPELHRREHSVEVEVPFVQHLFPRAKIVPIVVGTTDIDDCRRFGEKLAEIVRDRDVLIVASSDLSHYPEYEDAVDVDNKTLEAINTLDLEKLKSTIKEQMHRGISNLSTCACGEGPILITMAAANAMGVKHSFTISYANSGDAIIKDGSRAVGYGAVQFINPNSAQVSEGIVRTDFPPKECLLELARETIHRYLTTETLPLPRLKALFPNTWEGLRYNTHQGAFVTLKKNGELRGCIGHMAEDMPLQKCVGRMALSAAFNDRRFRPVELEELDDIEIEISVLTPFELVPSYKDIVIGRDGVVIKKGGRQAVYLPQVAPEQGWTREETLDHLCQKAGLPSGSWKEGAELYTFQAEVFSESEFEK